MCARTIYPYAILNERNTYVIVCARVHVCVPFFSSFFYLPSHTRTRFVFFSSSSSSSLYYSHVIRLFIWTFFSLVFLLHSVESLLNFQDIVNFYFTSSSVFFSFIFSFIYAYHLLRITLIRFMCVFSPFMVVLCSICGSSQSLYIVCLYFEFKFQLNMFTCVLRHMCYIKFVY